MEDAKGEEKHFTEVRLTGIFHKLREVHEEAWKKLE